MFRKLIKDSSLLAANGFLLSLSGFFTSIILFNNFSLNEIGDTYLIIGLAFIVNQIVSVASYQVIVAQGVSQSSSVSIVFTFILDLLLLIVRAILFYSVFLLFPVYTHLSKSIFFAIGGLFCILFYNSNFGQGVLYGKQKYLLICIISQVGSITKLILISSIIFFEMNWELIIIAIVSESVFVYICQVICTIVILSKINIRLSLGNPSGWWSEITSLCLSGWSINFALSLKRLTRDVAGQVVGLTLGSGDLALFNLMISLNAALLRVCDALKKPFLSLLSGMTPVMVMSTYYKFRKNYFTLFGFFVLLVYASFVIAGEWVFGILFPLVPELTDYYHTFLLTGFLIGLSVFHGPVFVLLKRYNRFIFVESIAGLTLIVVLWFAVESFGLYAISIAQAMSLTWLFIVGEYLIAKENLKNG